ncbi:MAG: FmdB family zinc ribbon protein [Terriglobales bacterium]
MPLYEYECSRCHKRLEKIQSFSAEPLRECPHCGGPLEKLISAPAIQFKGSGWYVTDYAKSGSSAPAKESKPPTETKSDGAAAPAAPAAAPAAAATASTSKSSSE